MSDIYRRVSVRMWGDADFRKLSAPPPNARDLWIYLLTGPHTTAVPGLFACTQEGLAAALKWPLKGFREALRELSPESGDAKRFLMADWEAGVVWIEGALKHNEPANPNVLKSWKKHFDMIPECDLKTRALTHLKAFADSKGKGFPDAFAMTFLNGSKNSSANGSGNGSPNGSGNGSGNHRAIQEQEQEQEPPNPPAESDQQAATGARSQAPANGNDVQPDLASARPPEPLRHLPALDDAIRAEFLRRDQSAQLVPRGQLADACKRIDDPVTRRSFPDAMSAIHALAASAVAESLKPNGKRTPLGLALLQVPFTPPTSSQANVLELRRAAGLTYIPRGDE